MKRFILCLSLMSFLTPVLAANAAEFPEMDASLRWSTVGAFEPEFGFFAERHYVDRLNPEVGVHVLPFLTVTGEYSYAHMMRKSNLDSGSYNDELTAHLRSHSAAIGARVHPNWRGVLLPFARVTVGFSVASIAFDSPGAGFHGYWRETASRPEVTIAGGTEILFPRGVRERSHMALGGKVNRIIRNGTVGLVIEAGHMFAPAYKFERFGELGVGQFTFEMGIVTHF